MAPPALTPAVQPWGPGAPCPVRCPPPPQSGLLCCTVLARRSASAAHSSHRAVTAARGAGLCGHACALALLFHTTFGPHALASPRSQLQRPTPQVVTSVVSPVCWILLGWAWPARGGATIGVGWGGGGSAWPLRRSYTTPLALTRGAGGVYAGSASPPLRPQLHASALLSAARPPSYSLRSVLVRCASLPHHLSLPSLPGGVGDVCDVGAGSCGVVVLALTRRAGCWGLAAARCDVWSHVVRARAALASDRCDTARARSRSRHITGP